ncbi:MAG: YaeQ family protein [Verrucomicrobiaceae bacterium]|nr:YaeQ family protein [Verrucomicrobiaceae bacterium]
MALKAIIHKASVSLSDLDRNIYADHELTLARHPSETEERMMVRLVAWMLNAPETNDHGTLEFGKGMWEPDEPSLVRDDLTGLRMHEIEIGQPEEKRLVRACGRSRQVTVYNCSAAGTAGAWWAGMADKLAKVRNLTVWQFPPDQVQTLGALADRAMTLQVTVQDGVVTVDGSGKSAEITPIRIFGCG